MRSGRIARAPARTRWHSLSPGHGVDGAGDARPGRAGLAQPVGLSVLLAVLIEMGLIAWFKLVREMRVWFRSLPRTRTRHGRIGSIAFCCGLVLVEQR